MILTLILVLSLLVNAAVLGVSVLTHLHHKEVAKDKAAVPFFVAPWNHPLKPYYPPEVTDNGGNARWSGINEP